MHGDEDDRMTLVSVVITDGVIFNMYVGYVCCILSSVCTGSNLRVKLHKTKRKLSESPAIDIANTFERLGIAPPSSHWLRCIEIRKPHVW